MAMDHKEAHAYLINPLLEPEPSAVTGPGTHFYQPSESSVSNSRGINTPISSTSPPQRSQSNRLRKSQSGSGSKASYPTPPQSASPRRSEFSSNNPFRDGASSRARTPSISSNNPFRDNASSRARTPSINLPPQEQISARRPSSSHGGSSPAYQQRARGASLGERFPGDTSHQPLDMLRSHSKRAQRAPHMRSKNRIGADKIDLLDPTATYHHEGPYDATYASRNRDFKHSPLEALATTNEEALKATPREKIQDSIDKHVPLDGVAYVPSGMTDREGNTYEYQEGENMMIAQGGNYKRWPGIEYHDDDLKGKSEPSYSIEKRLKEHRANKDGIEMTSQHRRSASNPNSYGHTRNSLSVPEATVGDFQAENDAAGVGRSNSRSISQGLKKRFGSLRRKDH